MDYPKRKRMRLPGYDYSQNNAYFVTICTYNRRNVFDIPVGATLCGRPPEIRSVNLMIEKWLHEIEKKFEETKIDKYVVMPNHIHLIINIVGDHTGSPLPKIMAWFKTMTTNAYLQGIQQNIYPPYEKHLWQRGYYDHIIRNNEDYLLIWKYIDDNQLKWFEDDYYRK